MNSGALLVNAAVPLVVLAVAWLTPSLTSPTLPFGVRIPAARADAPVIAEQRKRYRWLVGTAGGALAALSVGVSTTTHLVWPGVVPALILAVFLAAFNRARVAVAAAKRDEDWYRGLRQGVVTDTSLRTDPEAFPWLWSIPALLIVAATVVTSIVLYPAVPERLAVHFNASGIPDRFATKSVGSVFFPVFVQAGVTATILVLAWFSFRARPELDPARAADSTRRHRRFSVRAVISLLALAACVDLSMLAGAWPIWHADQKLSPVLVMLPILAGLAIVVGVAVRTGQGGSRLPAGSDGAPEENTGVVRRDDDRHWRSAGSLYFNRADPALHPLGEHMRGSTTTWRRCTLAVLMATVAIATTGPALGTAEAVTSTRSTPIVPAGDRQVRFTADGTTTYGTVHIPAHRAGQRLPAALLIPGSGLTDRNGDQPPATTPHTLALFASTLGEDGVMSLRFDKYGTGRTGWGRYKNSDHIDMAAYTRQAVAAYNALRAQPEADRNKLLIVGHSEGGLQALLVDRAVRTKPAGLALIAPQDTRLLDAIDYQLAGTLDRLVVAGELSSEQAQLNKTGVSRAIADFRAERQVDTSGLLPFIASLLNGLFDPHNATFVRSDDAIYPPDIARRVAHGTRALVTCGTADTNVPCRTTPPLLTALAAARTTGPGLRVLPGLDHFLHPAGTPVNDQMIAPAAQRALHDFVRPWQHLTTS